MLVNNFDTEANFWKINPQLCIVDRFKKLYSEDKSKGKDTSSRIMWAIALVYDYHSKFFSLPLEDKHYLMSADVIGDKKFNWKKHQEYIDEYLKLTTTPAIRHLTEWNKKMDERTEYIRSLKYGSDDAEMIDKLMVSTGKLFDELNRLSDMLTKEGEMGIVKGGMVESSGEKGDI